MRWQGMTKKRGRPHVMRNDAGSAPHMTSRRALRVVAEMISLIFSVTVV